MNVDEEEEEEILEFKNMATLEETLNWSKNFFENNFYIYIKYLMK